jgi:hypothetical protein
MYCRVCPRITSVTFLAATSLGTVIYTFDKSKKFLKLSVMKILKVNTLLPPKTTFARNSSVIALTNQPPLILTTDHNVTHCRFGPKALEETTWSEVRQFLYYILYMYNIYRLTLWI